MKPRRINYIGLCAISIVCLLLILASHRFTSNSYVTSDFYAIPASSNSLLVAEHQRHMNPKSSSLWYAKRSRYGDSFTSLSAPEGNTSGGGGALNATVAMLDILTMQQQQIAAEMDSFEFDDPSIQLKTLTPATGGKPYRSVILTTWRSGSTFLGDILNAMPANYYHYEPLLNYDIIQIREDSPHAATALRNIRQLLTCNYTNMNDYLDYGRTHTFLFHHNNRLWNYCRPYPQLCWNPKFLSSFCKLFPLQSMKVVRLRLSLAEALLTHPDLDNARFVLLVRDPRGTLQSRRHRDWCPGHPDCDEPAQLCDDLEADYWSAQTLLERFPQRLMVVRYEDLSLDPFRMTQTILQFYGLPFDVAVEKFLDTHTRNDIGGVSSTFRDSKSTPFHWITDLTWSEIDRIQASCTRAMQLWGYRIADRSTFRKRTFSPLRNYTLTATGTTTSAAAVAAATDTSTSNAFS